MEIEQPRERAKFQREYILRQMTEAIFQVFKFKPIELNSNLYYAVYSFCNIKPDLVLNNDNSLLIVELKAFPKDWICAEPEIAQILKYTVKVKINKDDFKQFPKKKFLLITSGTLAPYNTVGYFRKDIDFQKQSISPMIEERYETLLNEFEGTGSIDDRELRGIYKRILNLARQNKDFLHFDILDQLPIPSHEIDDLENLKKYLIEGREISIGLISGSSFQKIITELNKFRILDSFKKLQNTPIEELMSNNMILSALGLWDECVACKENKPPYIYCKYNCEIVRQYK
ncbi:MAG: hypothetical protein ACFFDN_10110 [Candidatus Hodarchaeota archaeon]